MMQALSHLDRQPCRFPIDQYQIGLAASRHTVIRSPFAGNHGHFTFPTASLSWLGKSKAIAKKMSLTREQSERYQSQGYLAPIRAISTADAASLRQQVEAAEAGPILVAPFLRNKTHLAFTWADALIRHPGVLDAVESVLGADILCWGSGFFIKNAHDPSFVSWHQDLTYWGLDPADIVTAWVAISDSDVGNGAMRVVAGTHLLDQIAHRDTFAANNLLSRGQEIAVEVDEAKAVALELRAGEMSLHHVRLVHGSDPNPSPRRRLGFAIRYLPTYVRQTVAKRDSATLVRGVDRFGNFAPEQRPAADLDAAALAHHADITGSLNNVLMRGTGLTM
jgi:non-heme Fe2+,alpha-ketoglutarate-dependent halogenase